MFGPIPSWILLGITLVLVVLLFRERRRAVRRKKAIDRILDNISHGYVTLDKNWRFTFINDRAAEALRAMKRDARALIGRTCWEAFPSPAGSNVETEFNLASSQKKAVEFDYFDPSGGRWFEINAVPIDDGVSVFFRDITDRKIAVEKTQKTLRELNDVKAALDEHAIVAITDSRGKITYVNDKFCAISQYSREELIGQDHRIINSRYHPKSFFANLWRTIGSGRVWKGEIKNRAKDGSFYWVDTTIMPYLGDDGKPVQYIAIRADITERKKAEEQTNAALRELNDVKAALDEHAIVAITDSRGKITYVNDKFCAISQYSREELLGQDHRIINSGYHPKLFFTNLWRTIECGRVWKGEIKNRAKDGSFYWVDTTIVPYLGDDGDPVQYIAIRADITERKKAEEALRDAQYKLQEHATILEQTVAQRTAELREKIGELEAFSYSVSHDMRQPLRSMQGYARILITEHAHHLDEESCRYLERIKTAANRLDRLIQDVLTYSRTTRMEGAMAQVDLGQTVSEIVETYPNLRDADIEIAIGDARVQANEAALTQCIANLLGNGVKFVKPGRQAKIRVWSEVNGRFIRLCVQDEGIGIAEADQERIFGIFGRVNSDDHYDGTGIGLSIVKKAVEKMGGSVGLKSEVGRGSLFWIDLQHADAPIAKSNMATPNEPHPSAPPFKPAS